MNSPSSPQSERAAKSQRLTESATTTAGACWRARKAGRRLFEHELRCEQCGALSEPPICGLCIETQLQAEVQQ